MNIIVPPRSDARKGLRSEPRRQQLLVLEEREHLAEGHGDRERVAVAVRPEGETAIDSKGVVLEELRREDPQAEADARADVAQRGGAGVAPDNAGVEEGDEAEVEGEDLERGEEAVLEVEADAPRAGEEAGG